MLVDDAVQAGGTEVDAASNTVSGQEQGTGDGANASLKGAGDAAGSPSFDWEAVTRHPEFKTHVKTHLEADEEFRKEASRGVRLTDVEKRANERAIELAAADRQRAEALQARLDAVEAERENARLSTMTLDEQEVYALNKRATAAEARLADYESRENLRAAESAREDIVSYAQKEWGLDDDAAAELRQSKDGTDLMDRALKAATRQRAKERAELDSLRTTAKAQGRVLDGTSTFAATGASASGGEMSDDEVADLYSRTGTSSPNYAKVRDLYARVYAKRGY